MIRILAETGFYLTDLADGRFVWSRRVDRDWLADQLQLEALVSAPAAPAAILQPRQDAGRADAEAGVDTRRGEGAGPDFAPGPGVGEPDDTAGELCPLPLHQMGRILRLRWTGVG